METSMEDQNPSASWVYSCGPNVSAVSRPAVARQVSNEAITSYFGAPQAPAAAAAITPRALAESPAVGVGAADAAAAPAPPLAEAPLAAPPQQQCSHSAC